MRYLLLICGGDDAAEHAANPMLQIRCKEWAEDLQRRGIQIHGQGLRPPMDATTVRKLAMYEPPITADGGGEPAAAIRRRLVELLDAGRRGDAAEHFMTEAVRIPPEMVAQIKSSPMWQGLDGIAHTLRYDTAITADGTLLTRRAGSVTVPTLVLCGADSSEFLRDAARNAARAVPGAGFQALAGQTHQVAVEVLAPVLAEFFG